MRSRAIALTACGVGIATLAEHLKYLCIPGTKYVRLAQDGLLPSTCQQRLGSRSRRFDRILPQSGRQRETLNWGQANSSIRALLKTAEISVQEVAKRFGVSRSTLYRNKLT
jgi:transcriptional regulator with PAS, ATPase and Fis domain